MLFADFQPTLDEQTVGNYIRLYKENPQQFQANDLRLIEQHANYYKMPFAYNPQDHEESVGGVVKQLSSGFLSGFTTVNVGDEPKGTYEGIARSIGHLAGFAGMIPIPGKLARISKLAGALKSLQGKSVPMLAAKAVEKRVAPIAKNVLNVASTGSKTARGAATSFLQSHKVQDIIGGAFHLGVASAVSSWQGGIDEMMKAFIHGAETGGVFRVIGNVVKTGSDVADKTLRSLSSSLYTGLPSTMRDATTPEQVYEYLLGAYFGYKEMPYHRREGAQFIAKMRNPKNKILDPELMPGWEKLDAKTQEFVKGETGTIFGSVAEDGSVREADVIAFRLAQRTGIPLKEAQAKAEEYLKSRPQYTSHGEEISELSPALREAPERIVGEKDRAMEDSPTSDKSAHDIGGNRLDGTFTKSTEWWVRDNLFEEGKEPSDDAVAERSLAVEDKWHELVKANKPNRINPADEMLAWMATEYGTTGRGEGKNSGWNYWRRRGETYIKASPIRMFSPTPDGLVDLRETEGINSVGNAKTINEDTKILDEVYNEVLADMHQEPVQLSIPFQEHGTIKWSRRSTNGYEVSTRGDKRFSALNAQLSTGETIESAYQRLKGSGKGQPSPDPNFDYWGTYSGLWEQWARENPALIEELRSKVVSSGENKVLTDRFASTDNNQARALAEILNKTSPISPELQQPTKAKRAYAIIDHAIVEREDARGWREIRFSELMSHFFKQAKHEVEMGAIDMEEGRSANAIAWEVAERRVKKFHGKNFREMDEKGYYYFGGRGDSERQYFMRYHPRTRKDTVGLDQQVRRIKTILKKHTKLDTTNVEHLFAKQLQEWKALGLSEESFKRAYVSNVLYEMGANGYKSTGKTFAQFEDVLGKGFINTAREFNKRQQIWFTSGIAASPEWIVQDPTIKNVDNGFRVLIVADEGFDKRTKTNRELWTDGAIYAADAPLDALNRGWGLPVDGGVNKSFIVARDTSPQQRGTILGKYMMHSASKGLQDAMSEYDIHFVIPASSVKQLGKYKPGSMYVNSVGEVKLRGDIITIPIDSVKGVFSETTDTSSLKNKRLPKQMFTNLTPYGHQRIMAGDIHNMYQDLSQKAYRGEGEWNDALDTYLSNPEKHKRMLPSLIENIDNIGVDRLLRIIKTPEGHRFANAAYHHLQRLNDTVVEDLLQEGEMSRGEYEDSKIESSEQTRVMERMATLMPDSLGITLHKSGKNYRMTTMRNYIVHRLTRPIVENSAAGRFRPYDPAFQYDANMRILKTKAGEEVFFLDDGFKQKRLAHPLWKGTMTLEEVWKQYQLGAAGRFKTAKDRAAIKELLTAATVRVPMDSLQGARVLRFGGFTGVRGYGVLAHPKVLEAEGGADLDGDKAYVFFGGEKGFKKRWKKMYSDQKDEFKDESTKEVKEAFAKDFTNERKFTREEEIVLQYSPNERRKLSEAASSGRNQLGPAVINRAVIKAAYASIRGSKEGFYEYTAESGEKIYMMPKRDPRAMQEFTRMSRALISYASDPMDYAGLKRPDVFFSKLIDSLFTWHVHTPNKDGVYKINRALTDSFNRGKRIRGKKGYQIDSEAVKLKREGATAIFSRINSALYGKNLSDGKRWTMAEIREKLNIAMGKMPSKGNVSFLGKLGNELVDVDWSDSLFLRLEAEKIKTAIEDHNKTLSKWQWLSHLFGRKNFGIPQNNSIIQFVARNKLYDPKTVREIVNKKDFDPKKFFKDVPNKERWIEQFEDIDENPNQRFALDRKIAVMDKIRDMAEDFIVNDLSDIASLNLITEKVRGMENQPAVIQAIVEKVNDLKKRSYLMMRRKSTESLNLAGLSEEEALLVRDIHTITESEGYSKLLGQKEIDRLAIDFKMNTLKNDQQRDFFDAVMLGTFNRGGAEHLAKLSKAIDRLVAKRNATKDKAEKKELFRRVNKLIDHEEKLTKHINSTSFSKLGFSSPAILGKNIKEYLQHYDSLFKQTGSVPDKVEQKRILDEAADAEKPQPMLDKDGKVIHGTTLEFARQDEATQKYLEDYAPFEGLKDGELKGEPLELYNELKDHFDYYHNSLGKKFSGLVRELFLKDVNNMTLEDWRVMNRWLRDARQGTFFQRLFRPLKKGQALDLSKWYYMMFPEAINRDMLRSELHLVESKIPYETRRGGWISGKGAKPAGLMGELVDVTHYGQDMAMRAYEEEKKNLREELDPYVNGVEEGPIIREVAIRLREKGVIGVLAKHYGTKGIFKHYVKGYSDPEREVRKRSKWDTELKDREITILTKGGPKRMTGEMIADKINDIYTQWNKRIATWIKGDPEKLKKYLSVDDGTLKGAYKLRMKFLTDLHAARVSGKRLDLGVGIDGLRQISKRIIVSQVGKGNEDLAHKINNDIRVEQSGLYDPEMYFPHGNFDKKLAKESLLRAMDTLSKDTTLSEERKGREMRNLTYHYKQLTGEWVPENDFAHVDESVMQALKSIGESKKRGEGKIKWFSVNQRVGNTMSRKIHIPGWDISPEAYETYMKSILDGYYRLVSQIATRTKITEFHLEHLKKHDTPDLTWRWTNFFHLYAQQALGFPSHIPEKILNDPGMKIKGTPFSWFADSVVRKRLNKVRHALGIKDKKGTPEELSGISYNQLAAWSNLEAKYELASLLAHPKSAVANLYGGTAHTVISTGWDNYKKAQDFEYLRRTINPKWRNAQDIYDWVISHGVVEEFMQYEASLNPALRDKKFMSFFNDAVKRIKKDAEFSDTNLRALARKHGVSQKLFDTAASFMRIPERKLRRDAFVAHYLQAKEKFSGAFEDYNHPYLIEMAKKGVKGTQFLYSAPFRPMFAATSLGKVMTRFQMWAWNSVRFRNDVIRQASIYGFKEGTAEFARFKRMATMDLLMLSLSSVFMYSLFENALPAPWNWFQDLADLMFGDEKDRERAFFGAYPSPLQPLQLVTPPAARILPPLFKGIVNDDYSKLANYYVWTMFPFGRLARDVVGKGGLLENPNRGVEKLTGLPYMQFAREFKKEQEKEKVHPRGIL